MLSMLVIAFLPRSKRLLISWLQSPSAVIFGAKKNSLLLFPYLFAMTWWDQMPWFSCIDTVIQHGRESRIEKILLIPLDVHYRIHSIVKSDTEYETTQSPTCSDRSTQNFQWYHLYKIVCHSMASKLSETLVIQPKLSELSKNNARHFNNMKSRHCSMC